MRLCAPGAPFDEGFVWLLRFQRLRFPIGAAQAVLKAESSS